MKHKTSELPFMRLVAVAAIATLGTVTIIGSGGGGGGGGSTPPAATLNSLAVTPATPTIALGTDQQFTATGSYSDGSNRNLTASANWSSSDLAVATIDAGGLATTNGQGATTITASVSGVSDSTTLTVDPASLVSLTVTPADPTLGYQGASQQFVATGTYSDQSTEDLTDTVTWSSSDTSVADIGSDGFASVTGISGSTTIRADSGGVSDTTTLSIRTGTVSGEINVPTSDMGWQPSFYTYLAEGGGRVRVQGTDVAVDVTATSATMATYTLTGVPWGNVTLVFDEGPSYDVFTQSSKRLSVNVAASAISGADFSFVYHWEELLGYPPAWGAMNTQAPAPWKAQFVSSEIAFVAFRLDNPAERIELYRTIDKGLNWTLIGQWTFDQAAWDTGTWPYPIHWQNFHFLDADRGVMHATTRGIPCDVGANYFYTGDGGQSWNTTALPLTPTGYHVQTGAYARIGDSHLIMAGRVGCGVQGYVAGFYDAIWESTNAGADWTLAWHAARDEWGPFIGVDANANGRAVAYRGAVIQQFVLRDDQGVWAPQAGSQVHNELRDIAMIDDTAWIASQGGGIPSGTFRSDDAGVSWQRVSDGVVQDFDFATLLKGFAQAGGPAHVTYDAGANWRYQSAGGAIWPGVMDVWAFSRNEAAWVETGFGDPNQTSQFFTYVEPWEANVEVRENVALDDANVARGATEVPMASLQLISHGPVPINMPLLTLNASGSGDDATDVAAVELWWDRNADGIIDGGDTVLSAGTFNADNGTVSLSTAGAGQLEQLYPVYLLVTFDMSSAGAYSGTYRVSLDIANITAEEAGTGSAVTVSAPTEFEIAPRSITVLP